MATAATAVAVPKVAASNGVSRLPMPKPATDAVPPLSTARTKTPRRKITTPRSAAPAGCCSLAARLLLVLETDELHQLRVRQQRHFNRRAPRLRVRLRIVDGDADVHVTEVLATELRRHMERLCGRLSQLVEPHAAVEPTALDDQGVAIPLRSRVSMPRWSNVGVRHELPPVHERLPP